MKIVLCVLFALLGGVALQEVPECEPCNPQGCPAVKENECAAGTVHDACGCCTVCAATVGQKCYNPSVSEATRQYGYCGENLDCFARTDLHSKDEPEAICVCKMQGEICGSNNYTYETQCHMALDAVKLKDPSSLYMKHAGPCHTVPVITSGPDDIAANIGEPVAMSCEVKGFPIPDIHWEFQNTDRQYSTVGKNLPSDDLFVAVQVRGGPEAYMTTSWVQIVSLRESDMGVYTCVATNKEGTVRAAARIRQY